jgi:tetratricopeptide (TPR) repeat protein
LRALQVKNESASKYDLGRLLVDISLCYVHLGYTEKALSVLDNAFKECLGNCEMEVIAEGNFAKGIALLQKGDQEEGIASLRTCYKLSKSAGNIRFQIESLNNIVPILVKEKKLRTALSLIEEAELLSKRIQYPEGLIDSYYNKSVYFNHIHQYERSAFYQDKYLQIKDSIYHNQLSSNLANGEIAYLERENDERVRIKNEILNLKDEIIGRQNLLVVLAISLATVLIILIAVLLRSLKRKRDITKMLDQKVKDRTLELELNIAQLISTRNNLEQAMKKNKDTFRERFISITGLCSLAQLEVTDDISLAYLEKLKESSLQALSSVQ